jgi:hypothetical protein
VRELDARPGPWPAAASLVACSPANVVLTTLKLSEEGDDLILRGYETAGRESEAEIELGLSGARCTVPWRPYEIKTLRWQKGAPAPTKVSMLEETAPLPPSVGVAGGIEGERMPPTSDQRPAPRKQTLRAELDAARQELLAAIARIPGGERSSRPVCGAWTLQDVLGHIADWERLGADGLAQMAAGQAPHVEHVTDIDAWNAAQVDARRGQSWERVWEDLHKARRALTETLERMSQAELEQTYPFPWGPEGTPCRWIAVYVDHDRSHARGLCAQFARE